MKMKMAMIFSFLVFFINGNMFGSSTQNSLDIDIKETEIADIRLDVNVMKENYHNLLKRVIDNANTIDSLEKDKQYLTHEVENLKRQLSCEIEVLHDITGEHQKELIETNFELNHTWYSFNKTVHELSYKVDVLENKFLRLELEKSEESLKRCTNKTELVSVCTFESTVEKTCLFSNDKSGLDNKDWIRHSNETGSYATGPIRAIAGEYYMYIEATYMEYLDNAILVSNILITDATMCLSFYYHMYGSHIGTLEVIVASLGTNQTIFTRSGNQGHQWYYMKLYINPESYFQIMFNGIDGKSYEGDIALDNIMLFSGECGPELNEASTQTTLP